MIKKITKIFLRSLLIMAFIIPYIFDTAIIVEAAKASRANTIAELRQELAALQAEKAANENKIKQTQSQINANKQAVVTAEHNKETIRSQIDQAEVDIVQSEKDIEKVKADTQEVLRYLQLSDGKNALLDFIADANSSSDLIVRSAIVSQITDYNNEQLQKLDDLIAKNKQLKIDLAAKNEELNKNIETYNTAVSKLGDEMASMSDIYADLGTQIKSLQESINSWKSICQSETQRLETCGAGVGYAAGWSKPTTSGKINSKYGNRSGGFHKGIDIGGLPEGTPVYATATGRVTAIWRQSSCGGNAVFINHNVNGKAYTTNYSHLLSINGSLSVGSVVTAQTQVGTLGGGSTKWYDKCTTGSHLHYQVNTGHYMGAGKDAYTSWATYSNTHVQPPGFPTSTNIWWYSR